MDPVLLVAEDGEAIVERPRREVRVLFEHELLDASYARSEGGERGASPHIHVEHVDAFYIVEGELSFVVGPDLDLVRASAGTFVMVPPNLIHGFDNDSDATARWLNFHAPSTGFLGWMRGDRGSFDMLPALEGGGRSADDAVIVRPGGGERYERSNRTIMILGDEPRFSALDIAFDESFHVDPHEHDDHADSFFVLEGEVEFTVAESAVQLGDACVNTRLPSSARTIVATTTLALVLDRTRRPPPHHVRGMPVVPASGRVGSACCTRLVPGLALRQIDAILAEGPSRLVAGDDCRELRHQHVPGGLHREPTGGRIVDVRPVF
jgi:quercetin dioxygenase-like cupin family protein